jgi:hypothetical protein
MSQTYRPDAVSLWAQMPNQETLSIRVWHIKQQLRHKTARLGTIQQARLAVGCYKRGLRFLPPSQGSAQGLMNPAETVVHEIERDGPATIVYQNDKEEKSK